ncbi:MAG TPA: HD domain-containing protein [Acidimicrobiales bacterium]|nr:HD domain-containing protein [Acidimicrobiales bacterium]
MAGLAHLARRFAGSLRPGGPGAEAERWVAEHLSPGELERWRTMSGPDRRHAHGVARRVVADLGDAATDPVVAAALLHDVGKTVSGLRTYGRVVATVSAAVAGREMAREWSRSRGYVRRVGLYLRHPELGADLLELAGSDPLTVAWAREHHLPEERWSVPVDIGRALRDADDD